MKTLAKWILAGLAFALGVMAAENADAFSIRSVRSLNAVQNSGAGFSFTNPPSGVNPFSPPGGGTQWTVIISAPAIPVGVTIAIEVQRIDGTWTALHTANITNGSGGSPFTPIYEQFFGPFQDVRVNITSYSFGTITADIYVEY